MYLATTVVYWMMMLYFGMARGTTLYNRYLLFGFVISLPFAALPFLDGSAGATSNRQVERCGLSRRLQCP